MCLSSDHLGSRDQFGRRKGGEQFTEIVAHLILQNTKLFVRAFQEEQIAQFFR